VLDLRQVQLAVHLQAIRLFLKNWDAAHA
jgi:hypothetical protein